MPGPPLFHARRVRLFAAARFRAVVLGLLAFACSHEPASDVPIPFEAHPPGLWYDGRFAQRVPLLTDEERAAFVALGEIGYVEAVYAAPEETGVVAWDPARARGGVNLYCSGHGAEARLIDMAGRVLHTWSLPVERLPAGVELDDPMQACWRCVRLLQDGSLVVVYEGLGIARVDRDSNLVWVRANHAHHDVEVMADESCFVLVREERLEPRVCTIAPIDDDYVVELDAQGAERRRVSIARALLESRWAETLRLAGAHGGDVMHANALRILQEEPRVPDPAFVAGRALVALRDLDALAVVDLETGRVEWMRRGPWVAPHAPSVLPDGRLLVFDNMGNEGYSRILAYDVTSGSAETLFAGSPPEAFFSIFSGGVQRLEGGNLLVTESYRGRAFELTPGGDKVWSFVSPHRAGPGDELVAVTFEVQRLDPATLTWRFGIAHRDSAH